MWIVYVYRVNNTTKEVVLIFYWLLLIWPYVVCVCMFCARVYLAGNRELHLYECKVCAFILSIGWQSFEPRWRMLPLYANITETSIHFARLKCKNHSTGWTMKHLVLALVGNTTSSIVMRPNLCSIVYYLLEAFFFSLVFSVSCVLFLAYLVSRSYVMPFT